MASRLCAGRGPGPDPSSPYYAPLNEELARALPRATILRIRRSGHDGLNRAPQRLLEPLAEFFAAPVTPARPAPR